jgi:hypothetical protein
MLDLRASDWGFAMSSKDWKPWWEKMADLDTAAEKEEFLRGVGGGKPRKPSTGVSTLLLGVLAGYIGGKIAQPRDKQ